MKTKSNLALILLAFSGAAVAQAPVRIVPGPMDRLQEVMEAEGTKLAQCVVAGVPGVSADVSAESGAEQVMRGCDREWRATVQATQRWIATLPEAQRAQAQELLDSDLANAPAEMKAEIAAEIVRRRAGTAAPSAPR